MAVEPRFPGSCHDAFVWRQSAFSRRLTSRSCIEPGEFLLGDSAYPLQPWLMTPVAGHPGPETPKGKYNATHGTMRSAVERCIGVLKSCFRCLQRHRTLGYQPRPAVCIIGACCVLHNLCLQERSSNDDSCSSGSDGEHSEADEAAVVDPPPGERLLLIRGRLIRDRIVARFAMPRARRVAYFQRLRRRVDRQLRRRH